MSRTVNATAENVIDYTLICAGINLEPRVGAVILKALREYGFIVTTEGDLTEALQRRLTEAFQTLRP